MISAYRSKYTNSDITIQGGKAADHANLFDRWREILIEKGLYLEKVISTYCLASSLSLSLTGTSNAAAIGSSNGLSTS